MVHDVGPHLYKYGASLQVAAWQVNARAAGGQPATSVIGFNLSFCSLSQQGLASSSRLKHLEAPEVIWPQRFGTVGRAGSSKSLLCSHVRRFKRHLHPSLECYMQEARTHACTYITHISTQKHKHITYHAVHLHDLECLMSLMDPCMQLCTCM